MPSNKEWEILFSKLRENGIDEKEILKAKFNVGLLRVLQVDNGVRDSKDWGNL